MDLVHATGRAPDEATELKLILYRATGSEDAPMVIDVGGARRPAGAGRAGRVGLLDVPPGPVSCPSWSMRTQRPSGSMVEAVACAVRFARGSEYGSETAPLVLTGFSADGGPPSHVALAGESFDRVWEAYEESGGGPQDQSTARSTRPRPASMASWVSPAATTPSWATRACMATTFCRSMKPDLWETLWGTVGLHPELRVRLIHGEVRLDHPVRELGRVRDRAGRSRLRRGAGGVPWWPQRTATHDDRDRDGASRVALRLAADTARPARGGPRLESVDDRGDQQPSVGDHRLESGALARVHDLRLLNPVGGMWRHTR